MSETSGWRRRISSGTWVALTLAALVVAGIGVQALLYQNAAQDRARDAARQSACVSQWAHDFTDVTQARVAVTGDLRDAQRAWTDAVTGIFTVFIAAFAATGGADDDEPPDPELLEQYGAALNAFDAASRGLADAYADVEDTNSDNPYPVLDLGCKPK